MQVKYYQKEFQEKARIWWRSLSINQQKAFQKKYKTIYDDALDSEIAEIFDKEGISEHIIDAGIKYTVKPIADKRFRKFSYNVYYKNQFVEKRDTYVYGNTQVEANNNAQSLIAHWNVTCAVFEISHRLLN